MNKKHSPRQTALNSAEAGIDASTNSKRSRLGMTAQTAANSLALFGAKITSGAKSADAYNGPNTTKSCSLGGELDKILDLLEDGISEVDYCPGGHKIDSYEREKAKALIAQREQEAEKKVYQTIMRNSPTEEMYRWPYDYSAMKLQEIYQLQSNQQGVNHGK